MKFIDIHRNIHRYFAASMNLKPFSDGFSKPFFMEA